MVHLYQVLRKQLLANFISYLQILVHSKSLKQFHIQSLNVCQVLSLKIRALDNVILGTESQIVVYPNIVNQL